MAMIRGVVILLALLVTACAAPITQRSADVPVTVGILAFNDFHGHLEPGPRGNAGIARLATTLAAARMRFPNNVTISAGDLIGASPLVSSLFLDEPTVTAMNMLGLDFNAVGNHEFDRGRAELLRMQNGGCDRHASRPPCAIEPFAGAKFRFLSASTFTKNGRTLFPAMGIKQFGIGPNRVSVGFIGLTLKETQTLVTPEGVIGLTFGDEIAAINAAVPRLKAQGADAVVVLIHQGGSATEDRDSENCATVTGPIIHILQELDPRVDIVVSGHTHQAYICEFKGNGDRSVLLTSAGKYGELLTEIDLAIDPRTDRVIAKRAVNVMLDRRIAPDTAVATYVARYASAVREIERRPVGRLSGPAIRSAPHGNGLAIGGPLGNLIADAQLAATRKARARIALTNPRGIRSDLQQGDGQLTTFGEIYAAQPFGNSLMTLTLTGAEIRTALEQGLDDEGPRQILAGSAGFRVVVVPAAPAGSRIRSITLDDRPLDDTASYRVTVNSFLVSGGDGFAAFASGRERTVGTGDLDALEAWLSATDVLAVPDEARAIIIDR